MSCTSKWRMFKVRLPASRTTANASGRTWSSVSPFARRCLNSSVLARSSASLKDSMRGSRALMARTVCMYLLISRSLRLPKIFLSRVAIIGRASVGLRVAHGGVAARTHKKQEGREAFQRPLTPHAAFFAALAGHPQEARGVLRYSPVTHLEVQVGARRAARI